MQITLARELVEKEAEGIQEVPEIQEIQEVPLLEAQEISLENLNLEAPAEKKSRFGGFRQKALKASQDMQAKAKKLADEATAAQAEAAEHEEKVLVAQDKIDDMLDGPKKNMKMQAVKVAAANAEKKANKAKTLAEAAAAAQAEADRDPRANEAKEELKVQEARHLESEAEAPAEKKSRFGGFRQKALKASQDMQAKAMKLADEAAAAQAEAVAQQEKVVEARERAKSMPAGAKKNMKMQVVKVAAASAERKSDEAKTLNEDAAAAKPEIEEAENN